MGVSEQETDWPDKRVVFWLLSRNGPAMQDNNLSLHVLVWFGLLCSILVNWVIIFYQA